MMTSSERKDVIRVFDSIAEEFCHVRRRVWKSVEDAGPVERNVVLDLGAGSGRNTKYLVEKGAAFVVAADLSVEMVKVLASNLKGSEREFVHLVRCDALYLPFLESIFDKVIFVATVHHIPSKEARARAIMEVWRVLKDRGLLLITAWSRLQGRFLWLLPDMVAGWLRGREFGDVYVPWGKEKRFYHLFTMRELRSLVKSAGFLIEKAYGERVSSKIFAENWVVLARKV